MAFRRRRFRRPLRRRYGRKRTVKGVRRRISRFKRRVRAIARGANMRYLENKNHYHVGAFTNQAAPLAGATYGPVQGVWAIDQGDGVNRRDGNEISAYYLRGDFELDYPDLWGNAASSRDRRMRIMVVQLLDTDMDMHEMFTSPDASGSYVDASFEPLQKGRFKVLYDRKMVVTKAGFSGLNWTESTAVTVAGTAASNNNHLNHFSVTVRLHGKVLRYKNADGTDIEQPIYFVFFGDALMAANWGGYARPIYVRDRGFQHFYKEK